MAKCLEFSENLLKMAIFPRGFQGKIGKNLKNLTFPAGFCLTKFTINLKYVSFCLYPARYGRHVKVEIVIFPAGWVFKLNNLPFLSNLFKYTIVPWFNFTLFVTINLYCMKPAYKIKKSIRLRGL